MVNIDTWPRPSLLMRGCPAVGGLSHYMSDLRIINSICLWGVARWRPWCVTANCVSVNWWPAECEDTMWHQSDTTLIQHNNTHIATLTNIFNKLQMFQGSSQKTRQQLSERKLFSIFSYILSTSLSTYNFQGPKRGFQVFSLSWEFSPSLLWQYMGKK